jgi:hypothetical protein
MATSASKAMDKVTAQRQGQAMCISKATTGIHWKLVAIQ